MRKIHPDTIYRGDCRQILKTFSDESIDMVITSPPYYALREGRPMRPNPLGRNMRTVWKISTKPFADAHFAVYPEKLIETPIKAGCPMDGIVLDPFIGSGTTAVVAKKLGRRYIGIELNPDYIKIAEKRLKQQLLF